MSPRTPPGGPPPAVVPGSVTSAQVWVRTVRAHQWVKNLLVFVPVACAHELSDRVLLGRSVLAFLSFSLCASSAYVLNDLLDRDADRNHAAKARRPIAAGLVSGRAAATASAALLAAGLGLGVTRLPGRFAALLAAYWLTTLAYSVALKRVEMLDVVVLAALYAGRVLGGTLATGVPTSSWLFTLSMFLFFSLALVKRTSELGNARGRAAKIGGRGYTAGDLDVLARLGTASGFVSVLVLALYISGPDVGRLYSHRDRLWLLCPLALYWLGRIWLLAARGAVDEDPVVFAVRDLPSYAVGVLAALIIASAV